MERRAPHVVRPFLWPSRVRKVVAHAPGARLSGDDGRMRRSCSTQVHVASQSAPVVGSLVWFNDVATLFTGRGWQLINGGLNGSVL